MKEDAGTVWRGIPSKYRRVDLYADARRAESAVIPSAIVRNSEKEIELPYSALAGRYVGKRLDCGHQETSQTQIYSARLGLHSACSECNIIDTDLD